MLFQSLFVTLALLTVVDSARPSDEIKLLNFNQSFWISNETYVFRLIPKEQIPLQVMRHVIYTATSEAVKGNAKRALKQNQNDLYDLAPEDYEVVSNLLQSDMPATLKVNTKKRALPVENGFRVIPLARKVRLLVAEGEELGLKRAGKKVNLGMSLCLHIPFITTCDNSQDLSDIKANIQAQTEAFRKEIDSYKETNNQRANEMAVTLDRQRNLITRLAQETSLSIGFISTIASSTAVNSAQIAHGDFIIHAQIDYLRRITNSLLRYNNALSSADPRSVVAQPSLTKLFTGYSKILDTIRADGNIPIVDQRLFNWTEVPLPTDSVKNIVTSTYPFLDDNEQTLASVGLLAVTTMTCAGAPQAGNNKCLSPVAGTITMNASNNAGRGDQWIFGPFHAAHIGIYPVTGNYNTTAFTTVVPTNTPAPMARQPTTGFNTAYTGSLFCVDFLGYKMLTTFNATPNMLNGITPGFAPNPITNCNNYRFRQNASVPARHFFLFGMAEGDVVVPFYSNCAPDVLRAQTKTTTPLSYLTNYPTISDTYPPSTPNSSVFTTFHLNAQHVVSAGCYINIEPEWLGMSYYFPDSVQTIPNLPRGFKLTQFTINPAGELASSLEFVYTNKWVWMYDVQRISSNNIVVDEASILETSDVLFFVDGDNVVDESDSFYGEGNNGRDCIRYRPTYEYDLLSCFYQNDQQGYSADQYLAGTVQTSGMARFINKFAMTVENWETTLPSGLPVKSYQFTFKPKADADFGFSVDSDGSVCPKLVTTSTSVSGCEYRLSYYGKSTVWFGPQSALITGPNNRAVLFGASNSTSITVTFNDVPLGVLRVGNDKATARECLVLNCLYGANTQTTTVKQTKPNTQVVDSDVLALRAKVDFQVDRTLKANIEDMNRIQQQVVDSQAALNVLVEQFNALNFNVSELVPYENFTELRNAVDKAIIKNLEKGGDGKPDCASGIFGSAACWAKDMGNTILLVLIVAAIAFAAYLVCCKFGVAKKLC